jgi:hypothetical protein
MIIGLNGRLKSGKDTTFGIIQELVPHARRVSFADPLKDSAAAALGIDRWLMEEMKGDEDAVWMLFDSSGSALGPMFNTREFLQRYGTEAHREVFGDDFWVDMALAPDLDHSGDLLVVTDMRFPNEAQRVRDLGGVTVKVVREVETGHSAHPSEQNIDHMIDYFLSNTGTLGELRSNVEELLINLGVEIPVRI